MRILVTGGSGFIGTNYIELLLQRGDAEVVNLSSHPPRDPAHRGFWTECDILDYFSLQKIIKGFSPTHVVHLAAKTGTDERRVDVFKANTDGVENLLKALQQVESVERVVFTSSALVCKIGYVPESDTDYCPTTAYGESKVRMEQIVRQAAESGLPFVWTIVRPVSIWGPWCGEPYAGFFKAVSRGWYFHIGRGHYRKSLGYVGNTAHQIHRLLLAPAQRVNRKTFYLADDPPTDLHDFAESIRKALGKPDPIRHMPIGMARLLALAGDALKRNGWKRVPLTSFRLRNILTEYIYDLHPIMDIASPLPYDSEAAIQLTVQWLRTSGKV